jgi:sterol desaturase/sphingolipid hydroxylase (fatty acid hydroxylase superfamily)
MTFLHASIALTLLLDGALVALLGWAFRLPRLAGHRLQLGPGMQVAAGHRLRTSVVTGTLSLAIVLSGVWLASGTVIVADDRSIARILVEAGAIVVLYDFIYYGAHRAMHLPAMLKRVHGIHHRARNPSAMESFYQHPLELMVGLGILFLTTAIVGPVHEATFAIVFFVYSTVNILVHSGFSFGLRATAPIDFLTKKHFVHHHDDSMANFSTMTGLPDLVFCTAK